MYCNFEVILKILDFNTIKLFQSAVIKHHVRNSLDQVVLMYWSCISQPESVYSCPETNQPSH